MNFQIEFLKNKIAETEQQIRAIQEREQFLTNEIKVTDEAKRLLEMLKTAKVKAKKEFILNVINTALNDIFQQDIKIEIRSSDEDQDIQSKQKKLQIKYDIVLLENGIEIGRNEKLLTSNGGGVLSVISLLLKILTGYIYSKNKFYIFDESLAQVSEIYQERLSLFLQQFCIHYGFTIVLINHNPKLATHAHMAYTLAASKLKSGLKKLKIEKLEDLRNEAKLIENPYKFDIKNFQSIEDLSFEFQGFVSITGANNIGKSAIVRAVNSLIFNNFQENYLRKGTSGSVIRMEHNDRWVEMHYKNKKIFYKFWDGDEASGKKLAQDLIQRKIEQIGFRFLNIGKMYKNWKADLKEQVDRLYVTTQHDKMYLIGSKSNDSDKLFNFLFNAEAIAQALINANYDLRILIQEQKDLFEQKQHLENELDKLKKRLKIEEFYFMRSIVEQLEEKNNQVSSVQHKIEKLKIFLEKFNLFEQSAKLYLRANSIDTEIESLKPRIQKGQKIVSIVVSISDKLKEFKAKNDLLISVQDTQNQLEVVKKEKDIASIKLDVITQLLEKLKEYKNTHDLINRYNNVVQKLNLCTNGIQQLNDWWTKTRNELGVTECECCKGLGYHVKQ